MNPQIIITPCSWAMITTALPAMLISEGRSATAASVEISTAASRSTVLYYVSLAGSNQNSFNITYSYVDAKYTSQALAIKSSIGGICGFLSSLAGSRVLSAVQDNGNMLFGLRVYGQQILGFVSFLLTISTVLFIRTVIIKQKVMIQ